MAGIYIHIPFCKQKCVYCDFFSVTTLKSKEEYLKTLCKEMELQKDYLTQETISTIYIGGGTPSILTPAEINFVLKSLEDYFVVENEAEITIEANPEQLTFSYLEKLQDFGKINRLSIGIQSFSDDDLRLLNRKHSAEQAIKAIKEAQNHGFNNLSIDLIYGIPYLSEEQWVLNLKTAFSLGIQHISAYALTVEPETILHHQIDMGKLPPLNEEEAVEHFKILMKMTEENGFEHYEISNFSLPGFASKHNSNYWKGISYLGLGTSAHSFNGVSRQWNCKNIYTYINNIMQGIFSYEQEILSPTDTYNEYIMVSLRMAEGISKAKLQTQHESVYQNHFSKHIQPLLEKGLIVETETHYKLSVQGKFYADGIAAGLFY